MNNLTIIAAISYVTILFLFCTWPFFQIKHEVENMQNENYLLDDKKEQLLQMLRDLQLDFQLQKISAQEFDNQNKSLRLELADTLHRLGFESHD